MSTYQWSIPTGNTINGLTYIKDTDNKLQATMDDLVEFVNGEGSHAGQGLAYDFVKSDTTAQVIGGIKTFTGSIIASNVITGSITGNSTTSNTLTTSRTISLAGDVSGSATFDGSADAVISATVQSSITDGLVPSGVILMWSGTIATIPSGWVLCDGTNNTPNLVDRFLVGAGGEYDVGATGGSKDAIIPAHSHTVSGTLSESGKHRHDSTALSYNGGAAFTTNVAPYGGTGKSYPAGGGGGTAGTRESNWTGPADDGTTQGDSHTHTFTGNIGVSGENATDKNLPPYYALAYIMKV